MWIPGGGGVLCGAVGVPLSVKEAVLRVSPCFIHMVYRCMGIWVGSM